jgi:hypothetical protein
MSFHLQIFKYADLPGKYFDLLCIISWKFFSFLLNVLNKVSTSPLLYIICVHGLRLPALSNEIDLLIKKKVSTPQSLCFHIVF